MCIQKDPSEDYELICPRFDEPGKLLHRTLGTLLLSSEPSSGLCVTTPDTHIRHSELGSGL